MRLFGLEITRSGVSWGEKQTNPVPTIPGDRGNWWWPVIREPYTGAWQRNMEIRVETTLAYAPVYACVTLISGDVSKLRLNLVEEVGDDIWRAVNVPAFSPVLRKPNRYQTRIKFIQQWVISKLVQGNTYVLKQRDQRGVVVAMYVLDPMRVKPLIADDGSVWYDCRSDNLSGLAESVRIPASEIIHDRAACLYHPLIGVPPLMAAALAAGQGLAIQGNSSMFFQNGSRPGGVLTAPGKIDTATAQRMKDYWEANYTGDNVGKIAVLGDGLKYESLAVTADDAQLIEQLKWTAENVCSAFHVPPYMIGVGPMPSYNNVEALNQQYYSQCLQLLIEDIEALLDEGLGLTTVTGHTYGVEFVLDDLLRMDTATKVKSWGDMVKAAIASPNEARAAFNLPPVVGGESPMIQQQNFSLEAIARRDEKDDPFSTAPAAPTPSDDDDEDQSPDDEDESDDEDLTEENIAQLEFEVRQGLSIRLGASP